MLIYEERGPLFCRCGCMLAWTGSLLIAPTLTPQRAQCTRCQTFWDVPRWKEIRAEYVVPQEEVIGV